MRGRPTGAPVSVARAVAAFLVAGLVVLTATGCGLAVLQRRAAEAEAVRQARSLTRLVAQGVIGWSLTDGALRPGPEQDVLDRVVRERVLGTSIVRVKVWDANGTILYSDDTAAIGRRFPLPDDERRALTGGGAPLAEISDLDEPEHAGERQFGKLLQVYVGVRTRQGTPVLFETYQSYDVISEATRRLWLGSLPALLGGLGLLYLLQAPLAYGMARRLRAAQEQREQLLVTSLAASDRERRRIAADLHDGVLQGLSGASYSLSAAAAAARVDGADATASAVDRTAVDLRRWVRELRSLVLTITPPALHQQGLAASLGDLAAPLESRGTSVRVCVDGLEGVRIDAASEALVYRVAQEAVRNVVRHAEAEHASLSLEVGEDGRLRLTVVDDGRGYDPEATTARRRGSVGLDLLRGLTAEHGGALTTRSAPGAGTTVQLEVPLRMAAPA